MEKIPFKMIAAAFTVLTVFTVPSLEQDQNSKVPVSPCPGVFTYETPGSEPGRWYGVVNLSTDTTLYSLWLNIILDQKANLLGNWEGDVSTNNNKDFKIESPKLVINPGPPVPFRFFVQFNPLEITPRLQAIRLNGKEICNADAPQPIMDNPDEEQDIRPNRLDMRPDTSSSRPLSRPNTESSRPVYVRPVQSPNPSSIHGSDVPSQNVATRITKRPEIPSYDDENVSNEDLNSFGGRIPTFIIPSANTNSNNYDKQIKCGTVVLNPIPLVVNGSATEVGQWPWHIALYITKKVNIHYICGGTLVSHRHVITAAHCITLSQSDKIVNKDTLMVYLGKHNLKTSTEGVQVKFVQNIIIHPEFVPVTYKKDVAILELRETVTYTDWVRPICLWPENKIGLEAVLGKKGSVVGWGYDDTGMLSEQLNLVEMPVVDQKTCIWSHSDFFGRLTSEYTYCAGYRDGTSVCNGDSGGGMVFRTGNTWYLRGLVSVAVKTKDNYSCDPSHYVIFTDLAKFLPWIKQNVYDY